MDPKKRRPFTLALVLALCLVFTAGAAKDTYAASYAMQQVSGYYRTESMMGISAETMATLMEYSSVEQAKDLFTLNLVQDGTCKFTTDGDTTDMYWNYDGTTFVLAGTPAPGAGDETITGSYADGIITLDIEGVELKLKKEGAGTQEQPAELPKYNVPAAAGSAVGVYRLDGMFGLTIETYASIADLTVEQARNSWIMELKADGSGVITLDGDKADLKWEQDGSNIYLIEEATGEKISGTIAGDKITLNFEGVNIDLKKDAPAENTNQGFSIGEMKPAAEGTKGDAGIYDILTFFDEGVSYSREELLNAGVTIGLILKNDGTGTISMMGTDLPVTWTDGQITVYSDDGAETFAYETMTLGGQKCLLLQDGATTFTFSLTTNSF